MKEFFKGIVDDLKSGKNIDVYVTFVVDVILVLLGVFSLISLQIIAAGILATLSLLLINGLVEKKELKNKIDASINIFKSEHQKSGSLSFFSESYVENSDGFKKAFQSAHELYVLGLGQNRLMVSYGAQIWRILEAGGNVFVILLDPEYHTLEMEQKRDSITQSLPFMLQEHLSAIRRLLSIPGSIKGKLIIKLVKFISPYTIYGFDVNHPQNARLYVWINPFKDTPDRRPGFVLDPINDPYWFNFFKQQYEKFLNWEEAKSVDLEYLQLMEKQMMKD